jgi:hypothetical protein
MPACGHQFNAVGDYEVVAIVPIQRDKCSIGSAGDAELFVGLHY